MRLLLFCAQITYLCELGVFGASEVIKNHLVPTFYSQFYEVNHEFE